MIILNKYQLSSILDPLYSYLHLDSVQHGCSKYEINMSISYMEMYNAIDLIVAIMLFILVYFII